MIQDGDSKSDISNVKNGMPVKINVKSLNKEVSGKVSEDEESKKFKIIDAKPNPKAGEKKQPKGRISKKAQNDMAEQLS